MKISVIRLSAVFLASLMFAGCGGNNSNVKPDESSAAASAKSLPAPTKDILVTDGDINKKYNILGPVDYKSDNSSIYTDQVEGNKQAKEILKKVAFQKYGEKVDAIINTKVQTTTNGGFWKMMGAAYGAPILTIFAEGVAVSYEGQAAAVQEPADAVAPDAAEAPKATRKPKRKSRSKR